MLELLTAAEDTVFRRGTGFALYLGPDRFDLQLATKELRHADATQVVDAEAQTVCPISPRCGTRGTVLRVPGRAIHSVGLD